MSKWVAEFDMPLIGHRGADHVEIEDGGQSVIYHVQDNDDDNGMFVRIQSWQTLKERVTDPLKLRNVHPKFAEFAGHRVRVTIETIEEGD